MSDNSNTGLTFGVDANVHNSLGMGQGQPLLLQKDFSGLSSQQLLTLAGEGIIEAWQNKTDPTQALVYAFASIFGINFEANAQIAFGEKFDIQKAKALGADILGGDYGVLPDFQFIDSIEINGSYAQSINTVFFDNLFVSQNAANPNAVGKVLVEELGHSIDAFASPVDSIGDEGKILEKLVSGEKLSSAELTSLKTEDDHNVLNIGGQQVAVEMDAVSGTANTLQTAKNIGVLGSTSQIFTGFVGDSGIHNYIKFQVTTPSTFAVELSGLTKDANVRLLNDQGGFIQASYNKGTAIDAFQYQLGVGTYYVHVYREAAGDNTNYSLKISAPPVTPVTNSLPIVPVGSTPISTAPPSVAPGTSPLGTIDGAGNTQDTARNIGTLTTKQTFNDLVGVNDKEDWYSFYIAEPGTANIAVTSNKGATVEFYKGTSMFSRSSTATNLTRSEYIYEPGQYFVKIAQNSLDQDSNYSIALSTTSSVVDLGSLSGTRNVAASSNIAYYRFKLTQNSVVTASSNFPNAVSFDVRDSSYSKTVGSWLNAGTLLNAGTYYLAVSNVSGAVVPASFALNLQATPSSRYDNAGLNYLTARDLGTLVGSSSVTDYIDRNDKYDYYSFTVGSKSTVSLNVAAITGSATVGVSLVSDKYASIGYSSGNASAAPKPLTATLEAGKYYVMINDATGTTDVQYRFDVNVQSLVANDAIGNSLSQSKDLGYLVPNTPITLKDAIGGTDPADWMKFNVSTLGNVSTAFSGLTTPITVQLSRIEANGALTPISTQNSSGQANWTPVFSNLVGNYALVVSSSNSTSTPYTLNLSTVSTNIAPTNVKWNFSGTYGSNEDIIVTGSVFDANGASDMDEAKFYVRSTDGSFTKTFSTTSFTTSATDSRVANFSINLGKLAIGKYTYNSDVYDKSRSPANTGTIIYPNGGYAAEVVYKAVSSGMQVASEILPYYSALSLAQQNKLGSPLSANATNTNGTWRQDFQGGVIIASVGSTPIVFFNDGTKYDLPNSLIPTLPTVGTLSSTGNVSGSLSSSDAKDQFRSAFYDDYALSGFAAGQQVRLTLTGSGFTPQIFLIDAVSGQTQKQSTVIQNGNQTILDFVVPTTGNYRVRVTSGNANQTGSYTLASGSIPVDPPVSGGSTGSTTTSYRITEPVDEAKEWKASLFSWNRNSGSTPPANFYDGGSNNPNWIGTLNLGSNNANGNVSGSAKLDWGTGTVKGNSQLPADGFAIRAYTWADFDGSDYKFTVRGDDGYQILAKKQGTGEWFYITPKDQWQTQGYGVQSQFSFKLPAGRYDLHFHYFENGGEAKMDLSWLKDSVVNPVLAQTGASSFDLTAGFSANTQQLTLTNIVDVGFGVQSTQLDPKDIGTVWTVIRPEKENEGKEHLVTINWGIWKWEEMIIIPKDGLLLKYEKRELDSYSRTITVSEFKGVKNVTTKTIIESGFGFYNQQKETPKFLTSGWREDSSTPNINLANYTSLLDKPKSQDLNQGLTTPTNKDVISILGQPTSKEVKNFIVTEDVGPFKVTGLKPAIEALKRIFAKVKLEEPNLYFRLSTDGMYNLRNVAGSSQFSNHSWGIAIDVKIGATQDVQGDNKVLEGLTRLYPYFYNEGFYWGAGYTTTEDSMHFEASKELIQKWKDEGKFK